MTKKQASDVSTQRIMERTHCATFLWMLKCILQGLDHQTDLQSGWHHLSLWSNSVVCSKVIKKNTLCTTLAELSDNYPISWYTSMEDFQWLWSLATLKYPKVQPLPYHKVLIFNVKKICVRFKSCHSGVAKESSLLRCYAVLTGT